MAAGASGLLATAEDVGKAGPIGLFLILSLLIAVLLLGRSMRTHLRRVPHEFPPPQPRTPPGSVEPPVSQGPAVIEGEVVDGPPDARRTGSDRDTTP